MGRHKLGKGGRRVEGTPGGNLRETEEEEEEEGNLLLRCVLAGVSAGEEEEEGLSISLSVSGPLLLRYSLGGVLGREGGGNAVKYKRGDFSLNFGRGL